MLLLAVYPDRCIAIDENKFIAYIACSILEKRTSLGLVRYKEFISVNNGNIWVESVVDERSEFSFTLKGK